MNKLAQETSPYLLQHADNPVQWHPWGEEALALAKAQDKPILLSVGYSACHWCHVMAHESFEDSATAAVMNTHFINIKVDREERPDIDQIYQTAHSVMTQRTGGWPLTMFLTPDQLPFYGGTYFPPTPRYGLPGFSGLIEKVAEAYHERKTDIAAQGHQLVAALNQRTGSATQTLSDAPIETGVEQLTAVFDSTHGGFGRAPKFPNAPDWVLFMRLAATGDGNAQHMLHKTLSAIAAGGIYDHLAGGFCRYSVDERWEIPHFEKMLYDNGQLLSLYSDGWLLTGEARWREVVEDSINWLLRDMQDAGGAFYAALDADSEDIEGKYYVWQTEQVKALLPEDVYPQFAAHYGLNDAPNFEHEFWNLRVNGLDDGAPHLTEARETLLKVREKRIPPGRDEKILTSWNALLIQGLSKAGRSFNRPEWIKTAQQAVDFIHQNLWVNGHLLACYKDNQARFNGYLDDYAFLLNALLDLLQAEYRQTDLDFAIDLSEALLSNFEDTENGGFFFTSHDHETLIQRPKSPFDNAIPSGNGITAFALQRLGHLLGELRYLHAAERTLFAFGEAINGNPAACPSLLCALQEWLTPPTVVVLRGETAVLKTWSQALAQQLLPHCVVITVPNGVDTGFVALNKPSENIVNAWVCRGVECLPVIHQLENLLSELA
ncbi:MAG: thioredoxin domain-containing protein [Methylophilaceae bacterium]